VRGVQGGEGGPGGRGAAGGAAGQGLLARGPASARSRPRAPSGAPHDVAATRATSGGASAPGAEWRGRCGGSSASAATRIGARPELAPPQDATPPREPAARSAAGGRDLRHACPVRHRRGGGRVCFGALVVVRTPRQSISHSSPGPSIVSTVACVSFTRLSRHGRRGLIAAFRARAHARRRRATGRRPRRRC
jgi:hypothetical protein